MKRDYPNQGKMLNNDQIVADDPMPSDEEIEGLFSKVLATMDLPPDKSKVLWNYDREKKWELIRDQKKVHAKQVPRYYLSRLQSYMDPRTSRLPKRKKHLDSGVSSTQVLRDLEISLRTNSIEWVREFLSDKNNGLNILIDYLTFRLLMLQHELIEKKLEVARKNSATTQTSTSLGINRDFLNGQDNDLFTNSSSEMSDNYRNGSKQNSLLNSLLASHANGNLSTIRLTNLSSNEERASNPKTSTLSSSSSSTTTNSTISSKSNTHDYNSLTEFKQKKSFSSLINTALTNSLQIYNATAKLSQEMSSRLDEAANQLTGNNLQQLITANQQLSSTLQLFPKNHSQKLNLGSVADDIHVCIMCLRSLMNNKRGFNIVMEHPQAINCLALSLNHTSTRTKTLVLELLAAICLVEGGHELIMSAFNNFKLACHERVRFETLTYYLKSQDNFNIDFLVACLQFINIIVHSVDDMNYRTHLQYEFTNLALDEYLDKLKQNDSEQLHVQIQTYLDNRIDVSALAEEAEAKNSALEQVQELLEKLSIANESLTSLQLNFQALDFRLQDTITQKEEYASAIKGLEQQNEQLKEDIKLYKSNLKDSTPYSCSSRGWRANELDTEVRINHEDDQSNGSTKITVTAKPRPAIYPAPPPPPPPPPPPSQATKLKQGVEIQLKQGPVPPAPPPPPPPPLPVNMSESGRKKGLAPQPPTTPFINASQQNKTTKQLQDQTRNDDANVSKKFNNNCDMMTLRKTFSTHYKLPTFNWSTLKPNQVRGTIFNDFHDEDKIIRTIDFSEFEEQFKLGNKGDVGKNRLNNNSSSSDQNDPSSDIAAKNSIGHQNSNNDDSNLSEKNSVHKRFKQPEKISFMEHNRLRNMAISLRKLSLSSDVIVSMINRLEVDQISLDNIEILLRMIPSQQEIKAYLDYDQQGKPVDALTEEDKFLSRISKVERLEQKVKIMFYMKNLEISQHSSNTISSSYSISSSLTDQGDLLLATRSKIEAIENAARSLKNSEGIKILLEYILVFGNYLNSSLRSLASAPAYGFKLQALDMVTEARSTQDKSRNLLHFIVDTVMKNLPTKEKAKLSSTDASHGSISHVSGGTARATAFEKRMSPVGNIDVDWLRMPYDFDNLLNELEQAASISLETLLSEVKEFERGIELCIKELHVRCTAAEALEKSMADLNCEQAGSRSSNLETSDESIVRLQKFIKSRSCDIVEIKEVIQRAQREFNECAQYFGENPRTLESSSLFAIFLRHLKSFKQCLVDNKLVQKRKFDEELRKQIQQQQALRTRKNRSSGNQPSEEREKLSSSDVEMKDNRLLQQDEVSHGTLDILITGLKVEPYRRADGLRKSIRRLSRQT